MLKPHKTHAETFESHMAVGKTKTRRISLAVAATLLAIGLVVGGWLAIDQWLETGELLPAFIQGTAWAVAFAVMTAAGSSKQCSEGCRLKKLYHRVRRRPGSFDETPWHKH